jgi:FkbM family methyltransferase
MSYPPIFDDYERVESTSDGQSIYDFLGGGIKAEYKAGWDKNIVPAGKSVRPSYPSLSEWTADWIAILLAVKNANSNFTVVELGAGYAQWMVSAIMAYKSKNPNGNAHGVALEADDVHYAWMQAHVEQNISSFTETATDLVYAAAGTDGKVKFPKLVDPMQNYGASYSLHPDNAELVDVDCLSLASIYERLPAQKVDLLHVDIQGAEVDLIADDRFSTCLAKTKFVLFGTHRSDELHNDVASSLTDAGFSILLNWPRNSDVQTKHGVVSTNDGAILAVNKNVDFSISDIEGEI